VPQSKILTAENNRNIDSRPLNYVSLWKWEDERWDKLNLQAGYSRNDTRCMEVYCVIPANVGKFNVYLEADGEFVIKHIGGKLDGSWLGNIAYDVSQRGWTVANYKGCKIENLQVNTTFVPGHPDAEMNGKSFDSARAIEVDWFASFELTCNDDEGSWMLYPPPIQKDSSYNYTVSYGNYTEKYCEWGAISIAIDEINEGSEPKSLRKREMAQVAPEGQPGEQTREKENSLYHEAGETNQGKDFKTLSVVGSDTERASDVESSDSADSVNKEEGIPDFEDENLWTKFTPLDPRDPMQRLELERYGNRLPERKSLDDGASTSSRLKGNLRPLSINPQPQEPSASDLDAARIKGLPSPKEQPADLKPTRTIHRWGPEPDLVEAWRPDINPGYSKEQVAAATVLAHGSIKDGRDMLERRDKHVLDGRSKWGSSLTSTLTGGTLKASAKSEKLSKLTTAERRQYELLKRQSGRTVAAEFLERILKDKQ